MASVGRHLDVMTQVRRISKQLNAVADLCAEPVESTLFTQAALVASEIRSVAPVDPESENPGSLRNSVRVEMGQPKGKKAYTVRILAGDAATVTDSAAGPYNRARAVEFGTVHMPAYPFFFAVWRARRKGVRATVRKAVKEAVRKVFR